MNKKHSINTDEVEINLNEEKTTEEIEQNENTAKAEEEIPNKDLMEKFHLILEAQQKQYEEKITNLEREKFTSLEQQKKQYTLEVEEAKKFALQKFAQEILLVGDALSAGVDAKPDNYDKFLDGIKMTESIFLSTLKKYNIQVIVVKIGDEFDEKFHECLGTDGEGTSIVKILTKGYVYNDRVLRAAQVIVGTKK